MGNREATTLKEPGTDDRAPPLAGRLLPPLLLAIAWAVQAVRVFFGIDFNDEMQYYGEIVSLVNSGRLFSTDLFLQQTVYLLLYPIFKPFILLWGTESLILAGRGLFAVFILWVFGRVRRTLVAAGVEPTAASMSALALTLAVPIYNLYAFSYNTVALGVTATCFAELFLWRSAGRAPNAPFWAVATGTLLLVYPPLAVGVGAVVMVRLLAERDYRTMLRVAAGACAMALMVGGLIFAFATIDAYLEALVFTRAIGVGTAIISSGLHLLTLLWGLVIAGLLLDRVPIRRWATEAAGGRPALVNLPVAFVSIYAAEQAMLGDVWLSAVVLTLTGLVLTSWVTGGEQRQTRMWIALMFLVVGSIMVFTSSNGFQQIQGAAMLAAPFHFALAMTEPGAGEVSPSLSHPGARGYGVGVIIVFATLFLANPYRDEGIWRQVHATEGAPAFRHLRVTENKAKAVALVREMLADVVPGSRAMVVGAHPWIYFATDTQPDTDMIFMHLTGGPLAYQMLATRLADRRPEYLIVAGPAPDAVNLAVARIADTAKYVCTSRPTAPLLQGANVSLQTYYDLLPKLVVCKLGAKPSTP